MEFFRLGTALLLPWLLGIAWLRWRWAQAPAGSWAVLLGYGYLLGHVATVLIMLLLDWLGLAQDFYTIAVILALLSAAGLWLARPVAWRGWAGGAIGATWRGQPAWQKWAFGFLMALVLIRLTGLALEVIWRPLYPWDAWMNWAPKARVWLEHRHLVPFVAPAEWLRNPSEETYTLYPAWHYPPAMPLIQLWIGLALGHWDESLINLPWLLCGMALALAFYGQLRLWGSAPLTAMIFTYCLLSMPFLNTHIALAGYAELWLATAYALAAMAFFHWARTGDVRQGILALLLAAACPLFKVPGVAWTATFLPALAVARLPAKMVSRIGMLLIITGLVWFVAGGVHLDVAGLGEITITPTRIVLPQVGQYTIEFHPVWEPFLDNYLILDNWHLLWYVLLVTMLTMLPGLRKNRAVLAMTALVFAGFVFLFVVFFLTRHFNAALDYTTINRATFHMVPMLAFYCAVLWHERWRARSVAPLETSGAVK